MKRLVLIIICLVSLIGCGSSGSGSQDQQGSVWSQRIYDWQQRQYDEIVTSTDQPTEPMIDPNEPAWKAFKAIKMSLRATENIIYEKESGDFWESFPSAQNNRTGDCDFFAGYHYFLIREAQVVADDHLRLALLKVSDTVSHMVVLIKIENNWYLVDNSSWRVLTLEEEDIIEVEFNVFRVF